MENNQGETKRGKNRKSLRTSDYVSTDTKISIKLMTKVRKATVFYWLEFQYYQNIKEQLIFLKILIYLYYKDRETLQQTEISSTGF